MRTYDILAHKRDGAALSDEEITWFVKEYTAGNVPDYQASALLMAIYIHGMNARETVTLTKRMAQSGDMLDLSSLGDATVDKHSTGGVGDKTTLIVAPIVAACGGVVAKMSGRGLGHTGGTVDKLESITGFRSDLSVDDFLAQVKRIHVSVVGQTGCLAPADKKLYALRDVTATVGCIPLIASSVMSKKLAAGNKSIVLDVKVGAGAFMKTVEDGVKLARTMVSIGEACGRRTCALITNMDVPLGNAVGNAVEVCEAVEVLKGGGAPELRELCTELAVQMLRLSLGLEDAVCRARVQAAIENGTAFEKLCEMVAAQGGNAALLNHPEQLLQTARQIPIFARRDGFVSSIDAEKIGTAAMALGAGREKKDDRIDPAAGIRITAHKGDYLHAGDLLATLYTERSERVDDATRLLLDAVAFSDTAPDAAPLIYEIING